MSISKYLSIAALSWLELPLPDIILPICDFKYKKQTIAEFDVPSSMVSSNELDKYVRCMNDELDFSLDKSDTQLYVTYWDFGHTFFSLFRFHLERQEAHEFEADPLGFCLASLEEEESLLFSGLFTDRELVALKVTTEGMSIIKILQ